MRNVPHFQPIKPPNMEIRRITPVSDKHEEIKRRPETVRNQAGLDDVLPRGHGPQGLIRRAFPTVKAMAEFEQTEAYREIHRMVTELRKQPPPEKA